MHETHGIALWPQHRFLADSRGRGWHDVYTSLATEHSWNQTLHAVPHLCLAYCRNRPAHIRRVIDDEGDRINVQLRPRLLGMVPADRDSHWQLQGTPEIQLIYLRRAMVEQVAMEACDADPARIEIQPSLGFADPFIEQLAIELLELARHDAGFSDGLHADAIARLLVLHLLRRHGTRVRSGGPVERTERLADARIRHVRDLIESALDEDLSLARLAGEAGIGSHAFSAAFTRAMGMTPHRYVLQRRIEKAKRLLREGTLPMVDVALQTGFSSQSHLTTAFRQATGVTPRAYQRSQ
ncbi:AraC family transcriptional regulator [Xenophilus sp. Marseille-Q4582]|uniref:AraC family transcriptional regulator n=1 Tax=Xenophilus sp. Marseille-Q4582 TaxID=2866600 RepID=UPI001CE47958|nr:AraC family transcriptional regulator [Xenophilus sp. Marseille-Q4582]